MIIETGQKINKIDLDIGELLGVVSEGSQRGFYPPIVRVNFSHYVFPSGVVGLVLHFEGASYQVEETNSIMLLPEAVVTGDAFEIDGVRYEMLGEAHVSDGEEGLPELAEEEEDRRPPLPSADERLAEILEGTSVDSDEPLWGAYRE